MKTIKKVKCQCCGKYVEEIKQCPHCGVRTITKESYDRLIKNSTKG